MHGWSTFASRMNHWHIQTHKTHHGPNMGEATTFPFIIFSVISQGNYIHMSFCPRTPKLEVSKFPKLGFPTF
jgi:hypothetical protein